MSYFTVASTEKQSLSLSLSLSIYIYIYIYIYVCVCVCVCMYVCTYILKNMKVIAKNIVIDSDRTFLFIKTSENCHLLKDITSSKLLTLIEFEGFQLNYWGT